MRSMVEGASGSARKRPLHRPSGGSPPPHCVGEDELTITITSRPLHRPAGGSPPPLRGGG